MATLINIRLYKMQIDMQKITLWEIVKALSTVVVVAVFSVKLFMIPTSLTIDFPMLLSLLLALFSVGLSALFYFKATDSSNKFYDNTHKFTRDIAQLLAKMESGFGERLRNLDEGYTSMRGYFQVEKTSSAAGVDTKYFEEVKKKLEAENEEYKRTVNERSVIIDELIEKSQLDKTDKDEISKRLKDKEFEILEMQNEIKKLNSNITVARFKNKNVDANKMRLSTKTGMDQYAMREVIKKIRTEEWSHMSSRSIRANFNSLIDNLHPAFLEDLNDCGYFENLSLTIKGVDYLRGLVESESADCKQKTNARL